MRIANFIDGQLVPAQSGATIENFEPAAGRVYGTLPDSDAGDIDSAVAAAQKAFPDWSARSPQERARFLLRIGALVERNLDRLAEAEAIDGGKPITRAKQREMPRVVQNFQYYAAAIQNERSAFYPASDGVLNYVLRRPRGVAGLISPWNLPLYLLTWKIAPAIATGNTVVAKPSEVTPATAHLFSELCIEAELPRGVVNIVHGLGARAGAALVAHANVPALSFTGGTATGRALAASAAGMLKRVSLELGGKNANIVFADAPAEALEHSVLAAFGNTGQICLCGSRLLVQRSILEEFTTAFVARTRALRIGDPMDSGTEIGSLVSRAQLEKTESYVRLAKEEGGRVLCGGARPTELPAHCREGYFHQPTVIANLGPKCRTNQEEIFGPVVTILPFDELNEAVEIANCTPYGLAATLWTRSLDTAHATASRLESGTVWVNCWSLRDLRVPFGGTKQSGLGREGGDEALRFFTEPKTVCVRVKE